MRLVPIVALALSLGCGGQRVVLASRAAGPRAPGAADDWRRGTIYLALTDRFADGNPMNDDAGEPSCHDAAAYDLFHGGDLAGLREHLPYLRDLGVTALWATPLYAQVPRLHDACGYHGYWANEVDPDDGALEPKLGTWDDVAALVRDLHAAGMRFVLDMVVNHPGRGARIVRQHPDWFHSDETCASLGERNVFCSLHGLPDYAQERPEVAAYLTEASRRWVRRVQPDGIRMDTVKHVPASYFATSFVPAVRAEHPGLFLVAEYFDDTGTAPLVPVLDAGFDSAFDFPLHRALVDVFAKGGPVDILADAVSSAIGTLGIERTTRLVSFVDNHDVSRFLSEAPAGVDADELSRRYTVALVALFTLPGIPQIYQGDELAMLGGYGRQRRDMPGWAWDAAARAGRHEGFAGDGRATFALVQSLVRLRSDDDALWRGGYTEVARARADANVLAFVRRDGVRPGDLVVLSGDPAAVRVRLDATSAGWLDGALAYDALGLGATPVVTVEGGTVSIALPAHGAAVYRARRASE